MDMVVDIYTITNYFPDSEKYGLVSQLRRAAVSIPSNIAEGAARKGNKENIQFLHISLGSIAEVDTQLIIADRLDFYNTKEIQKQLTIIKSKVINYIKYVKSL